ncbi:MAG: ATP-binding protein [Bacteroidetes bacterium]|nr:ATP-binding protein [Bacteroidota bacterium]
MSPADFMHAVHEDVAAMYCRIHVPIPALIDQLDVWHRQSSRPLVVTGRSESGKSGLLASWSEHLMRRGRHGVVRHFVEANPQGADHGAILRHILSNLQTDAIPPTPAGLEDALRTRIADARDLPLTIIIDGLDQLPDRSQDLRWLPQELPRMVRLIVSATTGSRAFDVACRRGWQQMEVPLPTEGMRRAFRERLSGAAPEAWPEAPEALAVECEEMVDAALTLTLEAFVGRMLAATRSEPSDELLRLVWGTRRGLRNIELCELMALRPDELAGLLHRMGQFIRLSGDCIVPAHKAVRAAVEQCLVRTPDEARDIHLRLAQYFSGMPLDGRRAEEEPWQWWRAGSRRGLRACIQNPLMFSAMMAAGCDHELWVYWRALGGSQEMTTAYRMAVNRWLASLYNMSEDASQVVSLLENLGTFLSACGLYPAAVDMLQQARDQRQRYLANDPIGLAHATATLGEILRRAGRFARAVELLHAAYDALATVPEVDAAVRAQVAGDLGLCLHESGDRTLTAAGSTHALEYLREALRLKTTRFGLYHMSTAETLSDLALVHQGQGDNRAAVMLHEEAIRIQREITGDTHGEDDHDPRYDHPALATSLNNLAGALHALGRSATAMTLYYQALDIRERMLGAEHPHTLLTRTNLVSLYLQRGDRESAHAMCEGIRAAVASVFDDDHPHYLAINTIVAQLLQALGHIDEACDLLIDTSGACLRTLGIEHQTTATALHNLAGLYRRQSRFKDSRECYEKALRAWRAVFGPDHMQVVAALCLLASVLCELGECDAGADTLAEAVAIMERILGPSNDTMFPTVCRLVSMLAGLDRHDEACAYLRHYIERHSNQEYESVAEARALFARLGCEELPYNHRTA